MTDIAAIKKALPYPVSDSEAITILCRLEDFGYTLRSTTPVRESSSRRTKRILGQIREQNKR